MRATTKEQGFYSQIFKLVLPIVIQNLLSAAVNSADVVMLNYVGQSAISAVSLASNYANVLFMVYYGLGTSTLFLINTLRYLRENSSKEPIPSRYLLRRIRWYKEKNRMK